MTYHEARMRAKSLSDRELWNLEAAEEKRLGQFGALNCKNPDHLTLIAAQDEHAYRKGKGQRYDG